MSPETKRYIRKFIEDTKEQNRKDREEFGSFKRMLGLALMGSLIFVGGAVGIEYSMEHGNDPGKPDSASRLLAEFLGAQQK